MSFRDNKLTFAASLAGFLGVAFGAFGAHYLKTRLTINELANFQTGVFYQFIHGVAALICSGAICQEAKIAPLLNKAGWCFIAGIILFSGSLYLITLTKITKFGIITPIGGLLFLAGWLLLIRVSLFKSED